MLGELYTKSKFSREFQFSFSTVGYLTMVQGKLMVLVAPSRMVAMFVMVVMATELEGVMGLVQDFLKCCHKKKSLVFL